MSRPLRIEYPGAWYHIMNRGRRGESFFEDNKDRELFVALLNESAELWDVRISAYCQMTTHYHIPAQTPQGNLSRFMRHLNGVYTQHIIGCMDMMVSSSVADSNPSLLRKIV